MNLEIRETEPGEGSSVIKLSEEVKWGMLKACARRQRTSRFTELDWNLEGCPGGEGTRMQGQNRNWSPTGAQKRVFLTGKLGSAQPLVWQSR